MKAITSNARYNQITDNMRIAIRYSFLVSLIFALIFAVAYVFNIEGRTELRFVNYALLFPIVYAALSKSYNQQNHKIEYFSGFSLAFLICAMGQLWYSILFFFYLHIDSVFLGNLLKQFPAISIYPELSISFIMLIEGICIGIIVALATMQYFKRKRGRWATTNS